MNIKDQYIDLLEARVEALKKEFDLLKEFVARDNQLFRNLSEETTMAMFEAFKNNESK